MEAIINDIKRGNLENNPNAINNMDISPLDKDILKPFKYLISIPGKEVRQTLIETLNYWLEIPQDKLKIISEIVFNVHNFSLLVDDIQDKSVLRRSVPAAHTLFGIGNTANSATFVEWINIGKAASLNHPRAVNVSGNSLKVMSAGQGMELYWRDNHICPTEEEYLEMVARKTGGAFHLANNLMQLFATKPRDLSKLLTSIGWYFQVNDDYQNLKSEIFFESKGFCEDLTEGKFGFPMVHAINTCPKEGEQILEILRQRTTDIALKKECVALIESCGSFEYTRNKIAEIRRIIYDELEKLEPNPFISTFFDKIIAASL